MNETGFNSSILIKKSPVVIVKNFIVLQVAAVAAFFIVAVMGDYVKIYRGLPIARLLSFHIAEAAGIFIFETSMVFYIFFRWYKEYYDIKPDKIVHARGIIFRKRTVLAMKDVSSISYSQGPLAKLTKYGTVSLHGGNIKDFQIKNIPEPRYYVELLGKLRDTSENPLNKKDNMTVEDIISSGEHERLEFKSSFRWDLKQNKVNKNLERSVMKTIVAFMNSNGGQLILGVNDSGNVVGLEDDYGSLPKQNPDGFENHFTNVFHSMIGPEYRQFVQLKFTRAGNKDCCLVRILPSSKPAYLQNDVNEEFFIRTGNGTTSLRLSEAASYIDSHWRGKLI